MGFYDHWRAYVGFGHYHSRGSQLRFPSHVVAADGCWLVERPHCWWEEDCVVNDTRSWS